MCGLGMREEEVWARHEGEVQEWGEMIQAGGLATRGFS